MSVAQDFINSNGISMVKVKRDTERIAKAYAPADTGNLRQNAIKKRNRGNLKWSINYNSFIANYIKWLNDGWTTKSGKRVDKHEGFIPKTAEEITLYLYSVFEQNNKFKKRSRRIASDMSTQAKSVNRISKMLLKDLDEQRDARGRKSISRVLKEIENEWSEKL